MFVMTVDQRRSRTDTDRVGTLLEQFAAHSLVRGFDRTAGDEVQAVADDPIQVVDIALTLIDDGHWSVGIGLGDVETPLPTVTRAGRGPAFEFARDAVTRAKNAPGGLAVSGPTTARSADAEALLTLLALLVTRRSREGREAVACMRTAPTQAAAAAHLGISAQAMSKRLTVAGWAAELAGRTTAARLLDAAENDTATSITTSTTDTTEDR